MTLPPLDTIYLHKTCRVCKADLVEVLNLGPLKLNTFPDTLVTLQQVQAVPVILCVCAGCGLAQLDRTVPPDWLYRTYWYRSSVNESMRAELRTIVREIEGRVSLTKEDWVLDIGANDGTLLSGYRGWGQHLDHQPRRTAVEPANNLQGLLAGHAEEVIHDYFPTPSLRQHRSYKAITAIAMCYDLEDPLRFFQALQAALHRDGVLVVQFQDLGQQLRATAFDNLCHEHLEYYTLHALAHVATAVGLVVVDCLTTPINGGSLRVTLQHAGGNRTISPRVDAQLELEEDQGLGTKTLRRHNLEAFTTFARRVAEVQQQIWATLEACTLQGRVVDVLGASTKGNILLQVLGLGPDRIRQAIDRDPMKTWRLTTTGIPIVGEEGMRVDTADVYFCPIWQFKATVLDRYDWFTTQGGTLVFPLPHVEIVRQAGVGR